MRAPLGREYYCPRPSVERVEQIFQVKHDYFALFSLIPRRDYAFVLLIALTVGDAASKVSGEISCEVIVAQLSHCPQHYRWYV